VGAAILAARGFEQTDHALILRRGGTMRFVDHDQFHAGKPRFEALVAECAPALDIVEQALRRGHDQLMLASGSSEDFGIGLGAAAVIAEATRESQLGHADGVRPDLPEGLDRLFEQLRGVRDPQRSARQIQQAFLVQTHRVLHRGAGLARAGRQGDDRARPARTLEFFARRLQYLFLKVGEWRQRDVATQPFSVVGGTIRRRAGETSGESRLARECDRRALAGMPARHRFDSGGACNPCTKFRLRQQVFAVSRDQNRGQRGFAERRWRCTRRFGDRAMRIEQFALDEPLQFRVSEQCGKSHGRLELLAREPRRHVGVVT
jgi:hypothetical protein